MLSWFWFFFHKVPFHHVISITYIRNFKRIFKPGTEALHRRPVPCFVVSQNSKQTQFRYHQKYQKYCIIIEFLFSQNNLSNLNFNQKFDYEFRTPGPNGDLDSLVSTPQVFTRGNRVEVSLPRFPYFTSISQFLTWLNLILVI